MEVGGAQLGQRHHGGPHRSEVVADELPRSSTPVPACRSPARSDPTHTPPRYSRSGGGSRSGSSCSGGNSHPAKSTSSCMSDMLCEHVFEYKHFAHIS